jgi:anti-sigma regulatory factor (Ser/Thr protein kinase)
LDWSIEVASVDDLPASRRRFTVYLARHAADQSQIDPAALVFTELVANVHRHAVGPASVELDWRDELASLSVRDRGRGFMPRIALPDDPASEHGRGLYLVSQVAGEITMTKSESGATVSVRLPLRRLRAPD